MPSILREENYPSSFTRERPRCLSIPTDSFRDRLALTLLARPFHSSGYSFARIFGTGAVNTWC